MSSIVDVAWFGGSARTVGAVLILDDIMGFKCYIGPASPDIEADEDFDVQYIRRMGTKVPVALAAAMFRGTMIDQWLKRNMWDKKRRDFRYDGHDYQAGALPVEVNT